MGIYNEYLDKRWDIRQIHNERKKQLKKISEIRKRDTFVVAANLSSPSKVPISIDYTDILPLKDQLETLNQTSADLILETPGGILESAEDIVRLIREKFKTVGVVIAGSAKSAGTIIAMSADEILMTSTSSLGPTDAQMNYRGRSIPADALINEFDRLKEETKNTGHLNIAYVPILQNTSLGEIKAARDANKLSQKLVKDWLIKYKFRGWKIHQSTGKTVFVEEKEKRAKEIAEKLSDSKKWLTHGRSIKMNELREMGLKITDYSMNKELYNAINRYFVLLQMTFEMTDIYKIFETPTSQIFRFIQIAPPHQIIGVKRDKRQPILFDIQCTKCNEITKIHAKTRGNEPLVEGFLKFPSDDILICKKCGASSNILALRQQIEAQIRQPIID